MSARLAKKEKDQLCKWIGEGKKTFQLIYSASRNGCSSTFFHEKCNNQGPTVTVLYNTSGCSFGGYTSVSWDNSGDYKEDTQAFLFRLSYKSSWDPKVYCCRRNDKKSIYCDSCFGPTFGEGHDLCCFKGNAHPVFWSSDLAFDLNGEMDHFGKTFNDKDDDAYAFACNNLSCRDLEVYRVSDRPPVILTKPWRAISENNQRALKRDIEKYAPVEGVKVKYVNVLLVGAVGSGKSSYFNTINSIFRGHVTAQAASGSAQYSLTRRYEAYRVHSAGRTLKFRLCDTRGLESCRGHLTCSGLLQIQAIIDGHLRSRYKFLSYDVINPFSSDFKLLPTLQDRIHCIVYVLDGGSVDVLGATMLETIESIREMANQRGIPQAALLTKVDKVCEDVSEDIENLFHSKRILDLVETTSQMIGLPQCHVFPVKNYENEAELNDSVDIPALISLRQILRFCDDFLYNVLDDDRIENWYRLPALLLASLIVVCAIILCRLFGA